MINDKLSSWNDGPVKRSIIDFLESTVEEGPNFVKPADRIATFDNDGTMWVEKPAPANIYFVIHNFLKAATEDPSLGKKQPYKAIIEKDMNFMQLIVEQDHDALMSVKEALAYAWGGITPDEFEEEVKEFIATNKQEKFDICYTDLVYKPMIELFNLLKEFEYRIFVCSGDERDFMRAFAEKTFGIFKENVIGTALQFEYKNGELKRMNKVLGGISLGPGKVEHIFAQTGRLPVFAAGNSDGDIEMLNCARFKLLLNHDDAEREYFYDEGAEKALGTANDEGYTVVSIKNDWKEIF
ncbi:MAG: HAD family hydrolase [Methanobacterium sp.]